jgi:Tfp pilus assembly protein PilX
VRRNIEASILVSLAVLVIVGLIALAARGKQRVAMGPGPVPP